MDIIFPCLLLWFTISAGALYYVSKYYWGMPEKVFKVLIGGAILTFLLFGIGFINIHTLDINHPVYSDGGISSLSIIISLLGGVLIAGPYAIIYYIDYEFFSAKRAERKFKKEKEKEKEKEKQ